MKMFKGLTWDHPRGYNALAAAEKAGGPVHWETQPLEGFESAPIVELCERYDLVVLDHPHLGEALASDCLRPMDEVLPDAALAEIAKGAVGPSCFSYVMQGRQWALPLDAATQVMAMRPDLLDTRPETWDDVINLSTNGCVALSLAGPHAFLSFLSICASLEPTLNMGDGDWPAQTSLRAAFEVLATLAIQSPASTRDLNPIGILDHMGRFDDVALVPLIYGYVNYAKPDLSKPIRFADAPRSGAGAPGSIVGGTGIAVSKRAKVNDTLRDHLLWLMAPDTQRGFIPDNDGQPGFECAWTDARVNTEWGGFYQGTLETLRASTMRPRHDGYIAFQTLASAFLRDALDSKASATSVARRLTEMFEASRQTKGAIHER